MTNPYYNPTGYPATKQKGSTSAPMRAEMAAVAAGFALLATLSGNGGKLLVINQAGTAQTVASKLSENANGGIVLAAPSSGDSLAIAQVSGGRGVNITGTNPEVRTTDGGANGAVVRMLANNAAGILDFTTNSTAVPGSIRVGNTEVMAFSTNRGVTIQAPASGVALAVNQFGSSTGVMVAATAGNAADITVMGNGNAAASGLQLQQDASNNAYVANRAAGSLNLSTNGSVRQTVGSAGNVTIAAPGSGDALTLNAVSGGRMILAESSLSGQGAIIKLSNTSNTPSSDAVMLISSAGGSAGDAYLRFDVAGATTYVIGIDNSDSDKLVISRTQTVGTSNVLEISSSGNVTITAPSSGAALTVNSVATGVGQRWTDATVTGDLSFTATNLQLGTTSSHGVAIVTNGSERLTVSAAGNIYGVGGSTGMTDGFIYVPSAAGAPVGVAAAVVSHVPLYYDTTNNKLYVYNGGWKASGVFA